MSTFMNIIGNTYLILVHNNKCKDALKKYGDLYKENKDLIRSKSSNSDNHDE